MLSNFDGSWLTNTTGTYDGLAGSLLYDGANHDLVFAAPGPTAQATLSSMQPTLRVGAYVEQTLGSTGDPSVSVRKGNPDLGVGVFAVWSQRTGKV